MSRDPYQVLGVPRTADAAAIKQAYRAQAKQYHPDVTGGDQAKEAKFKEASEAYAVLGDEDKRLRYDRLHPVPPPRTFDISFNFTPRWQAEETRRAEEVLRELARQQQAEETRREQARQRQRQTAEEILRERIRRVLRADDGQAALALLRELAAW